MFFEDLVAQACNLSYLGGLGSRVAGSRPAWEKYLKGLIAVFAQFYEQSNIDRLYLGC